MKRSEVSIKTRSTPASLSFKAQATKHTTVKWCIVCYNKVVLTLKSVGESAECDHSNESLRVVLCCVFVNYAVQVNSNS